MTRTAYRGKADLIEALDAANSLYGRSARDFLQALADADRAGLWLGDGCRNMGEWAAPRYGISQHRARRLVKTGYRLERLPALSDALASGTLSLDKTIELARFATPEDEQTLIPWARRVLPSTVRERADAANRPDDEAVKNAEVNRHLTWTRGLDHSLHLEGVLPAHEGSLVAKALKRIADALSSSPEDPKDPYRRRAARQADALATLAAGYLSSEGTGALLQIEVPLEILQTGEGPGALTEDGAALHPEVVRRLACDSCYETETVDGATTVGLGRTQRFPDARLRRAAARRTRGRCSFPGCDAKKYLQYHHTDPWHEKEGPTDLYKLTPVCGAHHKLVHEFGWRVEVTTRGTARWFRPDGSRYRARPRVPAEPPPRTRRAAPEDVVRCLRQEGEKGALASLAVIIRIARGEMPFLFPAEPRLQPALDRAPPLQSSG